MLCAFFARSPRGSMVMFYYYLLGGDTAAPSGLYARLCHAFLVITVLKKTLCDECDLKPSVGQLS